MATPWRTRHEPTDPATVPAWVLTFHAAEQHWMSLVDHAEEPNDYTPYGRSWAFWEAERIYRQVSKEWLLEHAPDLSIFDLWNEVSRRAGHPQIHLRSAARERAKTEKTTR